MDQNALELRLARLEARIELENLIGRYLHLRTAGEGERILNELWVDRRDSCIEVGASGKYHGTEKVGTFYQKDHLPGRFTLPLAVAPVIEVAEDLQSARGLWFVAGTETDAGDLSGAAPEEITDERRQLFSSHTEGGEGYSAEWFFQKWGIDFVLEDGAWKILHLHAYEIMRTPQDQDWVRFASRRFETDGIRLDELFKSNLPFPEDKPPENLATGRTEYHWQYTTDGVTAFVPVPPVPYRSLEDTETF